MRLKTLLAVGTTLTSMLLVQSASGATVELSLGSNDGEMHLDYRAAVGEINNVSIIEAPRGVYMINDLTAPITPETASCMSISPNSVRCVFADGDPIVFVHAEDGADTVNVDTGPNVNGYPTFIGGGDGPDRVKAAGFCIIDGGLGDDRLIGGRGGQVLAGGGGADALEGGLGNDDLEGGTGPDVMAGGPGLDHVSYTDHTGAVRISLDDRPNDGAPGEGDWVRADVEGAAGSRGPTTFIGNAGPNAFFGYYGGGAGDVVKAGAGDDFIRGADGRDLLSGGAGDDLIEGYTGRDVIRGGTGNDVLWGQSGSDNLSGGAGRDRLSGGTDGDTLRGGPGHDRMSGNGGADVIYARDRDREGVSGGPGHDRAQVDSFDELFSVETLF